MERLWREHYGSAGNGYLSHVRWLAEWQHSYDRFSKRPYQTTLGIDSTLAFGQGPGLTGPGPGTDFERIAKADPYWQCSLPNPVCPTFVDPARYTITANNPDLLYLQAPVGGTPITQVYTDGYTTLQSQSHGGSYESIVGFAFEQELGTKAFGIEFSRTLKISNQISVKNSWNRQLDTSTNSTATISITGPPCVVVGSTCNPLYNKSTQFDLYEDSLFGTFLLNPVN